MLGQALLAHLEVQLASARRLLDSVLAQGQAARRRDVEGVLARLHEVQVEMERRARLERDRSALLQHAGAQLGIPAHGVTLDALCGLLEDEAAVVARERSSELRGVLAEVGRQHSANRALMQQELAFLDHLTRMIGGGNTGPSYGATGRRTTGAPFGSATAGGVPGGSHLRALDLSA